MSVQEDNFKIYAPNFSCRHCHQLIDPSESPFIMILPSGTEQRWHVKCDAGQTESQKTKKKRR